MEPDFDAQLREGVELFNEGRFFECHEVWEKLWMETGGARADLLKGLLQGAIALHHFRRGNLVGARKLYEGQKRILGPFRPASEGLDLARFDREMDAAFAELARARPDERPTLDPAKVPRLAGPTQCGAP